MIPNRTSTSEILIAGMIGAGLALMFAPKSGKEMRGLLQQKLGSIKHTPSADVEMSDNVPNDLGEVQERMRIQRESKRQLPILTNWEKEL